MSKSRRQLDAISAVALAGRKHTEDRAACTLAYAEAGAIEMGWFVAERALDATPVNISFGKLQSLLAPVARYWWRAAAPPRHEADREQANI